jgi:glycosyltransferase involved in cell wall biosynthesis
MVKKLVWYIQEDEPEAWFDKFEKDRISKLMTKDKIVIYTNALGTVRNYRDFFGVEKNILGRPYRLDLPNKKICRVRSEDEFSQLRFIMLGDVGDGRKGQLMILFAFKLFKEKYYAKNPGRYRDFELVFVGMGDDFISRQIKLCAGGMLGRHFIGQRKMSRIDALEEVNKANITICYSIRECLPVFVFEGMASGHPILRNSCSGVDEQLINGENGFLLSEHDFDQVVSVIETMLNLSKTTNSRLAEMSKKSHEIAMKNANNSQEELLSIIFDCVSKS